MKFKTKIITAVTAGILALTGVGIGVGIGINNSLNSVINDSSEIVTNINSNGIEVKRSSTGTTAEGYPTIIFTYSITPENASIQGIKTELYFKDSKTSLNINDVMEVSVDESTKSITLICKQAFDSQINLKVISNMSDDLSAIVTVDYRQKLLNFEMDFDSLRNSLHTTDNYPSEDDAFGFSDNSINLKSLVTLETSKYTIDNGLNLDNILWNVDFDDYPHTFNFLGDCMEEIYADDEGSEFIVNLRWLILENLQSGEMKLPDASEIWELANGNETILNVLYKLSKIEGDPYAGRDAFKACIYIDLTGKDGYYSYDDFEITDTILINYSLTGIEVDSNYFTPTTGVSAESSSFEF